MKTATAKELRNRASALLESVKKGNEVVITLRGKSVAVLKPLSEEEKDFSPVGFGMWGKREDMKDGVQWVRKRRVERFRR